MFHLRAPALQTPPPDLSLRFNHSDGIFLVYEALIPAANPRPDAGYVAVWRDYVNESTHVFGRLLLDEADVGHALIALEDELGADIGEFEAGDAFLAACVTAAEAEAPDSTSWQDATHGAIAVVMEFDVSDPSDPDHLFADYTSDGFVAMGEDCENLYLLGSGDPPPPPIALSTLEEFYKVLAGGAECCGDPIDECCDQTDPCCNDPDPCCGDPDPCCDSQDPCCGIDCNDNSSCTTERCVEGFCEYTWHCGRDPNACEYRFCDDGSCAFETVDCDDGDDCTDDSCDPQIGCINEFNCEGERDPCRVYDCDGEGGCTDEEVDCDDNNDCTGPDTCDPEEGCVNPWLCEEPSDPCNQRWCDEGECEEEPIDCDDDNPCTIEHCDEELGCVYEPKCVTTNPCLPKRCLPDGRCVTDSPCADNNACTIDMCIKLGESSYACEHECLECTDCSEGGGPAACKGCSCQAAGCSVSLASGQVYECGQVKLILTADCWPNCGQMSIGIAGPPELGISAPDPVNCRGDGEQQFVTVTALDIPDPNPATLYVTASTSLGAACQTTAQVTVVQLDITGERIDQDDPTNVAWSALAKDSPVYGGSEPSTADNLRLTAVPSPGTVVNVLWTWSGDGDAVFDNPPTGPSALTWNLGDILAPEGGDIEFKALLTYADGRTECGRFPTEIGIRTDDVILVGWIDPTGVPLNPIGVDPNLLAAFPPGGPPPIFDLVPALLILDDLLEGDTSPDDIPMEVSSTAPPVNNLNRTYMLHWLFKFAANPDPATLIPGGDFRDAGDNHMSDSEFDAYVADSTKYKLINRFQVRYLVGSSAFKNTPVVVQTKHVIGDTSDPLGTFFVFPGQTGPNNHKLANTDQSIWHVNEGSPDQEAIIMFNTLMGNAVPGNPKFWESIGSRIRFRYDGGTDPVISVQVYPTYSEYRNGRLVSTHVQAPTPQGVFIQFAYPFGAVPCINMPVPQLQGRCGNAVSPEEPSARVPPFLP